MVVVYMAVRKVEVEAQKYTFASYRKGKQELNMSRRIMVQGILYSAAIASLCILIILLVVVSALDSSYAVDMLVAILAPLQGFWNALIYVKPQIEQTVKKMFIKSQQDVSNLIPDNQNMSKKESWLTRLRMMSWISERTSKQSKGSSSQQVEVQDKSKKAEDIEGGNEDRVGVLKVTTSKQETKMPHINKFSESKGKKSAMSKEMKGEDSNALSSSSLMLSCVEQEEADESLSFALTRNSELENEQSQLEYFSALEANTEGFDNVGNEDNDDGDNESYVDDYLRMMKLG